MTKDALDRPIAVQDVVPTKPGKTLRLSIDAAIQGKVEAVLSATGAKYRPKGATAIVMDPRNGEVLAMANWPRVDANAPSAAPDYARQNRAVGFDYEPGSTFKAFTIAGALEERAVDAGDELHRAAADPGRRPHDRGVAPARHRAR